MQFEQVTGSAEQMILTCSRPPTAASPCADDPRMLYRPVEPKKSVLASNLNVQEF